MAHLITCNILCFGKGSSPSTPCEERHGTQHTERSAKDASQQPVRSDPHCILHQIDRTTILQPSRIVAWIASSILRSMQWTWWFTILLCLTPCIWLPMHSAKRSKRPQCHDSSWRARNRLCDFMSLECADQPIVVCHNLPRSIKFLPEAMRMSLPADWHWSFASWWKKRLLRSCEAGLRPCGALPGPRCLHRQDLPGFVIWV